jgi:hypothetical protein
MPTATDRMSESEVAKRFVREFCTRPTCRFWRANTGLARAHTRAIRFGVRGQADWTGIVPVVQVLECPHCGGELSTPPLGVRTEVELKSSTGTQSDAQMDFQAIIEKYHGIYILARSVEDVHAALVSKGVQL